MKEEKVIKQEELKEEEDSKEKVKPRSSYYHTGIVYVEECENDFTKLGCSFALSPLHTPDNEDLKPHKHILFKNANKITGNSFQKYMCDTLGADFGKGFAYNPKKCVVTSPSQYLRYMVHLDNLNKQQFINNYLDIDTYGNLDKELLDAFDDIITADILDGLRKYKTSVYELSKTRLYSLWLRKSSNLYLYNTIRKEVNN